MGAMTDAVLGLGMPQSWREMTAQLRSMDEARDYRADGYRAEQARSALGRVLDVLVSGPAELWRLGRDGDQGVRLTHLSGRSVTISTSRGYWPRTGVYDARGRHIVTHHTGDGLTDALEWVYCPWVRHPAAHRVERCAWDCTTGSGLAALAGALDIDPELAVTPVDDRAVCTVARRDTQVRLAVYDGVLSAGTRLPTGREHSVVGADGVISLIDAVLYGITYEEEEEEEEEES